MPSCGSRTPLPTALSGPELKLPALPVDTYGAGGVACFLNTASIAAWAHFSPSALETPIAPITSPSTRIGKAPGCRKPCMKVGARFLPGPTILFIYQDGRPHPGRALDLSR